MSQFWTTWAEVLGVEKGASILPASVILGKSKIAALVLL